MKRRLTAETGSARVSEWLESLEARVLLSGDDHPDFDQFPDATFVPMAAQDGNGTWAGQLDAAIEDAGDSDVFRFTAPGNTDQTVVLAYQIPQGRLSTAVELRRPNQTLVAPAEPGSNGVAMVSMLGATQLVGGSDYYVVVRPGTLGGLAPDATGHYHLVITVHVPPAILPAPPPPPPPPGPPGPPPPPPGSGQGDGGDGAGTGGGWGDTVRLGDDNADADQWGSATVVQLDERTGDGTALGRIEQTGDGDLFAFRTPADGTVRVQVRSLTRPLFGASFRVFDQGEVARFFGTAAPGLAGDQFTGVAAAGSMFYVLVQGATEATGSYRVRIDTTPQRFFLAYPEGFSSGTVDEFVPMVNPGDEPVEYTLIARYETGDRDQVLAEGVIGAKSRGGVTITSRSEPGSGLTRTGEPYALEIRSTGQLGATLSHYDFGQTTGENFTGRVSQEWTMASAQRGGGFRDFLVFYNPSDVAANLTITLAYADGSTVTLHRTVEAMRRGGVSFNDDSGVSKDGVFGVRVDSDVGVVAALTSYDLGTSRGSGVLGDADGGAVKGVVPVVSGADPDAARVSIFNAGSGDASVGLTIESIDGPWVSMTRTVAVRAGVMVQMSLADLGVPAGANVSLRYTATAPVTLAVSGSGDGDGDGIAAATEAATTLLFADAFVSAAGAGTTYVERLNIVNPGGIAVTVRIDFLFTDGSVGGRNETLAAGGRAVVAIDQEASVRAHTGSAAFSISVSAARPVAATFTHLDRFLGGGWGTVGLPVGIETGLDAVN